MKSYIPRKIVFLSAGFACGKTTLMNRAAAKNPDVQAMSVSSTIMANVASASPMDRQKRLIRGSITLVNDARTDRLDTDCNMFVMDRSPLDYLDVCMDWPGDVARPLVADYKSHVRVTMAGSTTILPPVPPVQVFMDNWEDIATPDRVNYLINRYQLKDSVGQEQLIDMWRQSHSRSQARIRETLLGWDHEVVLIDGAQFYGQDYFSWQNFAMDWIGNLLELKRRGHN